MTQFVIFALYLCLSVSLLIIWPTFMHPTLSGRSKLLISLVAFLVLVPLALALYAWLGVPQMAATP